jgi:hypothetical protein
MIRIDVVTTGTSGFIVAIETADRKPGAGYDWDATGTAAVVGQLRRESADEEPERWTAWLWKRAGRYPARGQHSVTLLSLAGPPSEMARKLRKRHAAKGPWWSASDGRCPEVLEHDGEQWRCGIASVVVHKAHRDNEAAVEWMTEEDFEGGDG